MTTYEIWKQHQGNGPTIKIMVGLIGQNEAIQMFENEALNFEDEFDTYKLKLICKPERRMMFALRTL